MASDWKVPRIKPPKNRFIKRKLKIRKKRVKLPSIKSLKARAWKAFSLWVRKRGSPDNGISNVCITCQKVRPISELHASHWIDGRSNKVLFDERIVWPQCASENLYLNGNKLHYTRWMQNKFGIEKCDEILRESKELIKLTRFDYLTLIQKYES